MKYTCLELNIILIFYGEVILSDFHFGIVKRALKACVIC